MGKSPKLKVFLDTSALIAGIISSGGAARAVLQLAEIGLIEITVSKQVIVEADRTIKAKIPEMIDDYRNYIKILAPIMVDDPAKTEVKKFSKVIHPDDAPILTAAILSGADYLITWDKKHFLNKKIITASNIGIITPGDFLKIFRKHVEG